MTFSLSTVFLVLMAASVIGGAVGYSKLYFFHLVLCFLIFSFVYINLSKIMQSTFFKPKSRLLYLPYFMVIWYSFGLIWSVEQSYTVKYLFYIFIGVGIIYLVNSYSINKERYESIFKVLALFFMLAMMLSLLEAFTPFRLPTSPYSEYAVFFGRRGADFLVYSSDLKSLIKSTPTAFWANPNNLSVAMALIFPFFLMYKKFTIRLIGAVLIFSIVIMAGSRGVIVALLFALSLYFFIKGFLYWFPALVIGLLLLTFFSLNMDYFRQSENIRIAELAYLGEALNAYFFEENAGDNSIGIRQQLIKNGLEALWSTGGLGVGGGGSVAVQEEAGNVVGNITSMHNFWIEVLVDSGVLFFTLFMSWYFLILFKLYMIFKKNKAYFYYYHAGSLFLAMTLFLIAAVSASSVIYFFPMWLMLGLSIALITIHQKEVNYENSIAGRG